MRQPRVYYTELSGTAHSPAQFSKEVSNIVGLTAIVPCAQSWQPTGKDRKQHGCRLPKKPNILRGFLCRQLFNASFFAFRQKPPKQLGVFVSPSTY